MAAIRAAILSSVHDVGDARLHRHAAALAREGVEVELWGTGDAKRAPAGVEVHALPRRGLVGRTLRAATLPWRTSARVLISVDPDVAIASGLRARLGGRVHVADVHEDYEALLRDRGWAQGIARLPGLAIAILGRRAAEKADLATVADSHLVPAARRRLVVRNVPRLPEVAPRDARPRAVYVGDVRASRGLFAMLDAVEQAPGWTLDIVGPVAAADADACAEHVARLEGRVTLHGRLDPEVSWRVARGAWAGFVLLDETPAFVRATPSKLYEYLAHAIPVIASPLPAHVAILAEAGAGTVVPDARLAAETLRAWAADPDLVDTLASHARAWAEQSPAFGEGSDGLAVAVAALAVRRHVG